MERISSLTLREHFLNRRSQVPTKYPSTVRRGALCSTSRLYGRFHWSFIVRPLRLGLLPLVEAVTPTSSAGPSVPPVSSVSSTLSAQPTSTSPPPTSATTSVHSGRPDRSSGEGRDNRRRPADSRWDSPSPQRRSPPRRSSTGHHQRSSRSGRSSPPSVDLRVTCTDATEYQEFRRFQQRRSRE